MLERSEGLADWTEHHIQETQGISSHVSSRSSDQSTQLGHLSHLESRYRRKLQLRPVQIMCENWVFMSVPHRELVSSVMAYILIVLWFEQQ
jgi:hypothetical protein